MIIYYSDLKNDFTKMLKIKKMFLYILWIQSYKKKITGNWYHNEIWLKSVAVHTKSWGKFHKKKSAVSDLLYLIASPLASMTIWSLFGIESLKFHKYWGVSSWVHSSLMAAVSLGTDEMSVVFSMVFMWFQQYLIGFRSGPVDLVEGLLGQERFYALGGLAGRAILQKVRAAVNLHELQQVVSSTVW